MASNPIVHFHHLRAKSFLCMFHVLILLSSLPRKQLWSHGNLIVPFLMLNDMKRTSVKYISENESKAFHQVSYGSLLTRSSGLCGFRELQKVEYCEKNMLKCDGQLWNNIASRRHCTLPLSAVVQGPLAVTDVPFEYWLPILCNINNGLGFERAIFVLSLKSQLTPFLT